MRKSLTVSAGKWAGRSLLAIALVLGTSACLDHGAESAGPLVIKSPTGTALHHSLAMALHLHGWSNHAGNDRPASIVWTTQEYADAGVQVLWWTDHSDIYLGNMAPLVVTPVPPQRMGMRRWLVGRWGPGSTGLTVVDAALGDSVVVTADPSVIQVRAAAGSSSALDTAVIRFGYAPDGTFLRAPFPALARPIVADPQFRITIWQGPQATAFPHVDVTVPLAWHPGGPNGARDVLVYHLDRTTTARQAQQFGDTLSVLDSLGGGLADSAALLIAPRADALQFADGEDNTTDEYLVRVVIHRAAGGTSFSFRLPSLDNAQTVPAQLMADPPTLAHSVASLLGVRAMWGIETAARNAAIQASPWDSLVGGGRHMAVYLPTDVTPAQIPVFGGDPVTLSARVKALGGLTSITHPFGVAGGYPVQTLAEETQSIDALGSFLVANHAWNAQLIEVGYILRGQVDFSTHLRLLDYLLGSGVSICGVGATDSHGGYLLPTPAVGQEDENNAVTWVAGVGPESPPQMILDSLGACRDSFGNPFYIRGGLWIDLLQDQAGRQYVVPDAVGLTPSAQLYAFEAVIDSSDTGHFPQYRRFRQRVGRNDVLAVGGCVPGFVRLEAWVGDYPIGASNVVSLPPEASCPSPASRLLRSHAGR